MTREALLEEVLRLPQRDRAEVAAEILASLDDSPAEDPAEIEKAWALEIELRARRALAGETSGASWGEVRRRIEGRLAR
ncbi:MAG: addiction module protein [Acidobacteria bacterium]|nr:addiction module protein [Acidobacteriota bacterium]